MEYDIFPWEDGDDNLLSQSKNHQDAMLTDSNDFLSLIRIIVNQATRSGSLSKALRDASPYTKKLADALNIPKEAAFFLSFFIDNVSADSIGTPLISFAEEIDCTLTEVLSYFGHFKYLQDNGYLIKKGAGIYSVPDEVLMAISENRPFNGIDYYNKVLSFTANKDIVSRRLFFDDALSYRVRAMGKLLTGDAFERFQEAMNQGSHNTGFCALFYGESGTGKTELAFQLARKTRRDILTIDCSEVASKWIGDSEKNARKIFNTYRIFSKNPWVKPILLLNEADSLMSKRIHANSEGSIDNNRIVNIFLEEMEKFDGILIATCNDKSMLDSAFFRRFLFKLEFKIPDEGTRIKILMDKLHVSENVAATIAKKHITGAQIENMARAQIIDNIVGNADTELYS